MENERFLDLAIAELSNDRNKFNEKTDGLIETFKNERIEAYSKLASHIRSLQEKGLIDKDQADQKMSELVDVSAEEFGEPLHILEIESIGIFEQYEKQKKILEEIGILQILPETQKLGVVGINDREYPLPSLVEISKSLSQEDVEVLKQKIDQGFTKLMMVPFPMNLLKLLEVHKELAMKKSNQSVLKSMKGEPILLDEEHGFFVSAEYEWYNEDPEKSFIYYFEADENGYSPQRNKNSKKELLENGRGWNIVLTQDFHPMIDKAGRRLDGRLDDEYMTSAEDLLEILKENPQFENEKPFAVEDWSMYAMLALAEKNVQIDYDDQVCLAIGGFFQQANVGYHTPTCFCMKTERTEGVNINFARTDDRDGSHGIRTFVNVKF